MKPLDRLCLTAITAATLWTSWTLHYAMVRIIDGHEANAKAYGIMAAKALDERNLAESHVAYLQKEIDRWHVSNFKQGKSGDPKESRAKKEGKK